MNITELAKIISICSAQSIELQPHNLNARARNFIARLITALESDGNDSSEIEEMKEALRNMMPHLKDEEHT